MLECVAVPTTDPNGRLKMAFDVTLVDSEPHLHSSKGGETCFQGKEIGKALVVLRRPANALKPINNLKVLLLTGYRNDGQDFDQETKDTVVEACKTVAEVLWG